MWGLGGEEEDISREDEKDKYLVDILQAMQISLSDIKSYLW